MKSELLKKHINEIGLSLENDQVKKFLIFEELLIEWNKHMNLTGITESEMIYDKHFADSLTCILSSKIKPESKIIDVGTGAGFPGIPLKIYYPDLKMTLLDSLNKRIIFLKAVAQEAQLKDIEFLHGRAEDYGRDQSHREQYDIVVSRAVADLPVLLEFCSPFIKVGGYFIAQKGKKYLEEIDAASSALQLLNLEVDEIQRVKTSDATNDHFLVIIRKTGPTDLKYPRRPGKPIKKPL